MSQFNQMANVPFPYYVLGAQQAVGAEHVSDIGVYYDPWQPPAGQLQNTHQALGGLSGFVAYGDWRRWRRGF